MASSRVAKKREQKEGGAKKSSLSLKDIKAARKRKELEKQAAHPEFAPSLPSVNLFPDNVREDLEKNKAIKMVAAAGVAAIFAVGGLWVMQGPGIDEANQRLTAAQSEQTELQGEIRGLTPVKTLYDQITAEEGIVNAALASRVDVIKVLDNINQVTAAGPITVGSMTMSFESSPTIKGKCPSPDPFAVSVTVGCINLSATAASTADVANFLTVTSQNPMFTNAYTGATTTSRDGGVTFSATVAITPQALEVPLTPEQIEALSKPVEKKPEKPSEDGGDGGDGGDDAEAPAE